MPTRDEIFSEINNLRSINPIDEIRRKYLKALADYTKHDVLLYSTAWTSFQNAQCPPSLTMITLQDIPGFMSALHGLKNKSLDIVIHSPGGSPDATEQIVSYLRSKYREIRAIIPHNAMSAATMLACAADEIIMGKHSAIGPIDPQIIFNNFSAPAQAIVDEFEEAKRSISKDPNTAPLWLKRMDKYPNGVLKICEDLIALSKTRVAEWLSSWMLKDNSDKEDVSNNIAKWLGESKNHKAHGKPICFEDAKIHGLKVVRLEDDQKLQEAVLSLYHATCATHEHTSCVKLIENHEGKGLVVNINKKQQ